MHALIAAGSPMGDIRTWLESIGAAEFEGVFLSRGFVTPHSARGLTDGDLREMGIDKLKTRKLVFHALQQLGPAGAPPGDSTWGRRGDSIGGGRTSPPGLIQSPAPFSSPGMGIGAGNEGGSGLGLFSGLGTDLGSAWSGGVGGWGASSSGQGTESGSSWGVGCLCHTYQSAYGRLAAS